MKVFKIIAVLFGVICLSACDETPTPVLPADVDKKMDIYFIKNQIKSAENYLLKLKPSQQGDWKFRLMEVYIGAGDPKSVQRILDTISDSDWKLPALNKTKDDWGKPIKEIKNKAYWEKRIQEVYQFLKAAGR